MRIFTRVDLGSSKTSLGSSRTRIKSNQTRKIVQLSSNCLEVGFCNCRMCLKRNKYSYLIYRGLSARLFLHDFSGGSKNDFHSQF